MSVYKKCFNMLFFCGLLCFQVSFVAAQSKKIDSAKAFLKHSKANGQASILNDISSLYFNYSLDSGLNYANKAAKLALQYKQYSQLARAYSYAGQYYYYKSDYKLSIESFNRSYQAAFTGNDKPKMIEAINNAANVLIDQGDIGLAISKYQQVVQLSQQYHDETNLVIGYNNLAYAYRSIGDYNQSIFYLMKRIKIDEEKNRKNGLANGYQQLGMVYLQKKDYPNALHYLSQSNMLFKQLNDFRNMAVALSLLSNYYKETGNKNLAIKYLNEAIHLADKMKDQRSLAVFQSSLARYYTENKDYTEAEKAYQQSITLHEKIGLKKTLPSALIGYGRLLVLLNRNSEAKTYLSRGLKLAGDQKLLAEQKSAYEGYTEYYINEKDIANALTYKNTFVRYKDSLLNENNNKVINDLYIQYETAKKEAAIKLLNSQNLLQQAELQKNQLQLLAKNLELDKKNLLLNNQKLLLQKNESQLARSKAELKNKEDKINILDLNNRLQKAQLQKKNFLIFGISLLLAVLVLLAWLIFNRYKMKQEALLQAKIIQQQDMAAKAVINAEENERQRMSTTLHDGLGQLLSVAKMNIHSLASQLEGNETYQKTLSLIDESIKEMRSVSHQMVSNTLIRLGLGMALKNMIDKIDSKKIRIHLNIEGLKTDIDQHIQLVMYRIFQECINNVIKHAKATYLDISVIQENDFLDATIEDNGVGFDIDKLESDRGIGLDNVKTRVQFLKGVLEIDSKPGKGTLIAIHIPLT